MLGGVSPNRYRVRDQRINAVRRSGFLARLVGRFLYAINAVRRLGCRPANGVGGGFEAASSLRHLTLYLAFLALACATICCPVAVAQQDQPLVLFDLATLGPPYDFGAWLQDALAREPLELRWPDLDEAGALEDVPACVVTWSDPTRSGDEARQLRGQLRHAGGMVYVVGGGRAHLSAARAFWAPLDVNLRQASGGSGFPEWSDHPLTEGLTSLGAATPSCLISGPSGEPLIAVAGQATAMGFDWGGQGRSVVVDQALFGDPLSSQRPRPAMRQFLVRCVRWTAEASAAQPSPGPGPGTQPGPKPEPEFDIPEPGPIQPLSSNR